MKPSPRVVIAACMLLALGGYAPRAGAQGRERGQPRPTPPASEPEPEAFLETLNVSVVNVEVYVTDKRGRPVTGLKREDFEIFENGRPVEVTNFYAVSEGKAAAPVPEPERAAAAPAPKRDLEAVRTPEDQRLRLIIYIDNFNLHPFNRNRVMSELRAFIGQKLGRDDELMLVTYDRELHIRRTFTSDPGLIAAAMQDLAAVSAQGGHAETERQDALRNIQESRSVAEAENWARSHAQSAYNDVSFSIDALKKLVDSLSGLPGRKAVVYVSDGLQRIAGRDVFQAVQNKYGEQSSILLQALEFDVSGRLAELTAQANANRITFYTIDAAGLRTYDSVSAAVQGPGPSAPGLSQLVDAERINNFQDTLRLMAERTGGVAVLNTNVFTPDLDRIARDFNTYYSLGYTPAHFGDGRYYKIEVKLKNRKELKALAVRHREGYRDKSIESRMTDGTLAALSFPFEANPLGVSLEIGRARPEENGFFLVPVTVRIPIGKLVLVPREETEEAKVRLFIAAMDSDGGTSDVQQEPVPISIPKAEVARAQSRQYAYTVTLRMRGRDQRIAVGVRDDIAAQESFVSRGVRVGR